MFAGDMKLKHFLTLAGGAGVIAAGAGGFWWSQRPERPDPPPAVAVQPTRVGSKAPMKSPPAAVRAEGHVTRLSAVAGTALGADKQKDAWGSGSPKVNLYQDDGHGTVNRAKVDLDRDDKWDEKWTFHDDGSITRQVAPNDDEDYSVEHRRTAGGDWGGDASGPDAPPDAAASSAASSPGPSAAASLPPWEQEALSWAGKPVGSSKIKDAKKGMAWKINVYQDDGHSTANRAKLDLDRDDKWDEKWTFGDDGRISRQVAPLDDEAYTQTWVWTGTAWAEDPG